MVPATSPVKAPLGSKYMFWPPTARGEPLAAATTASRYGAGGHTPTSTPRTPAAVFAVAFASAAAPARSVFIFQLPHINGLRILLPSVARV